MSNGEHIFRELCEAPDTDARVRSLEPWAWRDLYSWLLRNYSENGLSGQVLGLMLVESANRYAAMCKPTRPENLSAANFEKTETIY